MKKFSLRLLMLAALVSIACSAYTPKTIHHLAPPPATLPTADLRDALGGSRDATASQMFYWFLEPLDLFNDYANLSYEIAEMTSLTGGLVNTDATGGICLAMGYAFPYLPHTMFPQVGLYLHL